MDNRINSYTNQQIADVICDWVRRHAEISSFTNFTNLRIFNNSDGLAFEIEKFEVISPSEGV